jgi:large subunit ribosomal protein L9
LDKRSGKIIKKMKVLFLQEVKGVGRKGEIKNVSDGHARNFLIPKRMVVVATPKIIKEWEFKIKKGETESQERKIAIDSVTSKIEDNQFQFSVKTGKNNEVFNSIHQDEIKKSLVDFLKKENSSLFGEEDVHLDVKPIKDLGSHKVKAKIGRGEYIKSVEIKIEILPEAK